MKFRAAVAAVAACFVLAVPGTVLAASNPTQDAYSGAAGQQQQQQPPPAQQPSGNQESPTSDNLGNVAGDQQSSPGEPASTSSGEPASESSSGTLPFTGLEIGLIAIVGFGLIGGGIMLYRKNRHRAQHSG